VITSYKNKAIKRLSISFLLFVLAIFLIGMRASGFPEVIFAVGMILLLTFTFIFYVQGNIALAQAKGYDGSVVAAVVIVAALCFGFLFFAMPLILLFGLKDKSPKRRRSHSKDPEPLRRNPPAILPPRREQ
jgi:hypothetical protein